MLFCFYFVVNFDSIVGIAGIADWTFGCGLWRLGVFLPGFPDVAAWLLTIWRSQRPLLIRLSSSMAALRRGLGHGV